MKCKYKFFPWKQFETKIFFKLHIIVKLVCIYKKLLFFKNFFDKFNQFLLQFTNFFATTLPGFFDQFHISGMCL